MSGDSRPSHRAIADLSPPRLLALGLLLLATAAPVTAQGLTVTSVAFSPDREFPDMLQYFREGWPLKDELGQAKQYVQEVRPGAALHVFVRNRGDEPIEITRVLLNGLDLAEQLAPRHREHGGLRAASFLLNDEDVTPADVRERLEAVGGPVWWMVRPNPVSPRGFAKAVIRLRRLPATKRIVVALGTDARVLARARLSPESPARLAIASVNFSQDLDRILMYVRSTDGSDFAIRSVEVDGATVEPDRPTETASVRGFVPLEVLLPEPWEYGTFHHLAVTTTDGVTAATVIRARDAFFSLGMWGYRNDGLTLQDMVRDCVTTFRDHLFNTHMGMAGAHTSYLESTAGLGLLKEMGLRLMAGAPEPEDLRSPQLYARFLLDEPDCRDYAVDGLPWNLRIGAYAQALVQRQQEWTADDPRTLTLLNVDMTFKPENWLTYGQLPDIFALDPYYQNRLRDAYFSHPGWLPQFCHPYYVHAVSEIARSVVEPRPLHVILNCVSNRSGERTFRYGTPEEKRIEFYYALAAGAKGISYWWFTPYGAHRGCGAVEPGAHAMLQELARLNAEARATAPLLAAACPAAAPGRRDPFTSTRPVWLWARTLFAGADTAIVILVNRDHASDRVGTVYQPIPKARVTFHVPPWMARVSAFRFAHGNIEAVTLSSEGDAVTAELENVELTEMLIISARGSLQADVQRRWQTLQPRLEPVLARTFVEYSAQRKQAAEEREAQLKRRREELFARYAPHPERLVQASERLGTYGFETERIWNPTGAKYNAQTWWVARGDVTYEAVRGLRWKPPRPGRYRVAVNFIAGNEYRLRLLGAGGEVLAQRTLPREFPRRSKVEEWTQDFPEGAVLEFVELGKDARGEMWGRVSPFAYFLPAEPD